MRAERREWVLLFTDLFGAVGGIPAFNQEFVRAFRDIAKAQGWSVRVLVLNDEKTVRSSSKYYTYQGFGRNRWRFVWESLRAFRNADVVFFGHVHFSPLALAVPGAPCWMIAHGIEVWGRLGWLRRLGLGRMKKVLCVSQFTRDRLIKRHGVKARQTTLFPNTARLAALSSKERPALRGLSGRKVIFTVSRLWPQERYKKIDRVIEAMPRVLHTIPKAVYVIAGEGADRPRLEALSQKLGVSRHIVFAGKLTDAQLRAYYEACDVFILPSLGEGFGIVFLEAMACGKPCIGAEAGAVPEVIDHGRTGLVVKPDDAGAIAVALTSLLRNDAMRRSMGKAGRERFSDDYAPNRFHERLARIAGRAR